MVVKNYTDVKQKGQGSLTLLAHMSVCNVLSPFLSPIMSRSLVKEFYDAKQAGNE